MQPGKKWPAPKVRRSIAIDQPDPAAKPDGRKKNLRYFGEFLLRHSRC